MSRAKKGKFGNKKCIDKIQILMYRYVTIFVYYFTNKNIILSSIGYFGINIKSHRLMGFYIYLGSKPVDGNSLPNILAL